MAFYPKPGPLWTATDVVDVCFVVLWSDEVPVVGTPRVCTGATCLDKDREPIDGLTGIDPVGQLAALANALCGREGVVWETDL